MDSNNEFTFNSNNKKESLFKTSFELHGKTAIVTGGAGILGEKFCIGLASSGASVAILDINVDRGNEIASSLIKNYGVLAKSYLCDVSLYNSVNEVVSKIKKDFGEINILVNNASSKTANLNEYFAPFENYSLEEWKTIMSTNIDGMFLVAQSVGRVLVQQNKGGSIIQMSSIYGLLAPDQRIYIGSNYLGREINTPAVYSVSKAAVVGLTKYLSSYWAPFNIRVNTISPGGVQTGQNKTFVKNYSSRVPLNRMADINEITGTVLFLASNASSYVTGQNIFVDGGLSAW